MRAITSGRFDPPHLGHFCNLKRIEGRYPKLRVFILDYPGRRYPIDYCVKVLEEACDGYDIEFIVNKTHFGKISKEELESLNFDVYCGGNLVVLRHIEELGFRVNYFERAYNFEASKYSDPE